MFEMNPINAPGTSLPHEGQLDNVEQAGEIFRYFNTVSFHYDVLPI